MACLICDREVAAPELRCKRCSATIHYQCGLGFDPPDELKSCEAKEEYICAPCLVGTSYGLLHLSLEAHSRCKSPTLDYEGSFRREVDEGTRDSAPLLTPVHSVANSTSDTDVDHASDSATSASPTEAATSPSPAEADPDSATFDLQAMFNLHGAGRRVSDTKAQTPPEQKKPDPPKAKSSFRARDAGEDRVARDPVEPDNTMAPPHEACVNRSKKLAYILRTLQYLPGHPNTAIMGDSHLNHVDGKEVDPTDDQVRIRSVGGLCIIATVLALIQHTFVHKKFRRVVWVLGTNDCLHIHQHCLDDRLKYIKMLYDHSRRIFPNACIEFLLPFSGMKGVSAAYINQLKEDINYACPDMAVVLPPSVSNKISIGGVHLNKAGKSVFLDFLRRKFVTPKQRVFASDSGRRPPQSSMSTEAPPEQRAQNVQPVQNVPPKSQAVHTGDINVVRQEAEVHGREPRLPPGQHPGVITSVRQVPMPPRIPVPPIGPNQFSAPEDSAPPDLQGYIRRVAAGVVDEMLKRHHPQVYRPMYRPMYYPPMQPWDGYGYHREDI